ncbi:MAG: ATP-grasp domain-containing protein [Clostridiales bacterium]|nr:ATP-grasp domain-containing protein [Clostridiales bacterium]
MNIWLVYQEEDVTKNQWYIDQYIQLGKRIGMNIQLVLVEDLTMICKQGKYHLLWKHKLVKLPKGAIVRAINPKLSAFFECLGIRVFNRAVISEICNDKAKTYQNIVPLNIPMIPTVCCRHRDLVHVLENMSLPAVVKTVDGHGGQEVFLIHQLDSNVSDILEKTTSDFVVQPLIGSKHQDLRIYILGKEIFAAVLRTSNSEFKANYSLGGSVQRYELNEKEIQLIDQIVNKFDFDLVGIDFIIGDEGELIFNEIEDVVGARMLYECTDIDIVWEYLIYIRQHLV